MVDKAATKTPFTRWREATPLQNKRMDAIWPRSSGCRRSPRWRPDLWVAAPGDVSESIGGLGGGGTAPGCLPPGRYQDPADGAAPDSSTKNLDLHPLKLDLWRKRGPKKNHRHHYDFPVSRVYISEGYLNQGDLAMRRLLILLL